MKNKKFAYVLGVLASDGYTGYGCDRSVVGLSVKDKEFSDKFKQYFEHCFNIELNEYFYELPSDNHADIYTKVINHRPTCQQLGDFRGEHWHNTITKRFDWVLEERYWWDFMSGFFDGDGSVRCPYSTYRIQLHIGYNEPAKWLRQQLKTFGFDFSIEYRCEPDRTNRVKSLTLCNVEDIIRFAKLIKCSIPRKENRLKRYRNATIERPKYWDNPEYVWKQLRVLREMGIKRRDMPTHPSLVEYEINYNTVRNWLHKSKVPTKETLNRGRAYNVII